MSFWLSKSSGRDCEYIVLRHTLRGANYNVNGVKFRDGYAVVEKGSKVHIGLKKIPVLRAAQEFPLTWLRKLPFITRPLDVRNVYGVDVYVKYLKELETELAQEAQTKKVEQEIKHVEEKNCAHRTEKSGGQDLCKEKALEQSPSGLCLRHILSEPRLQELGIDVPRFIPKKDKWAMKEKVAEELAKLKKEGKF